MKKNTALFYRLAFAVSFITSLVLFSLPGKKVPALAWLNIPHLDKYIHAIIFFTLCYTAASSIYGYTHKKIGSLLSVFIAGVFLLYGIGVEFYQEGIVEGRSFEIADIMADASGCCIFLVWVKLTGGSKKSWPL